MNLWGTTTIENFDAVQCRGSRLSEQQHDSASVVVIGSGGRAFWEGLDAAGKVRAPQPRPDYNPIDDMSVELIGGEAERLRELGYPCCSIFPFDPPSRRLNFLKLAESAGLGVISPVIRLLLHPEFGPWVSLRGALVFERQIPSRGELRDFAPCSGCEAPCLKACPVSTYGPAGEIHLDRCASHRHVGGCSGGCDVRRACPVGQEHRYAPKEEAFRHADSLPTLRKYFGLGWWRMVPKRVRRFL